MLASYLRENDIDLPATEEQYADLDRMVHHHVKHPGVVRVKIWSASGEILYSDEPALVGQTFPVEGGLTQALTGRSVSVVSDLDRKENAFESDGGKLIEIYTPIRSQNSGRVRAVLEVYEDYGRVEARIQESRQTIYLIAGAALAVLYGVLFVIHRIGARIMGRQRNELLKKSTDLERSYDETLTALARALDQRDHATQDHGRRVSDLACLLTREMGLPEDEVKYITRAAVIHDIGKMTLPDAVLLKPGPLTDEEWGQMRRHPQLGYEMLKDIPVLNGTAGIVYAHHEAYDGSGYPRGLRGDEIPIGARIFAVVDTYDAITSDRPYRKAASHEEAMAEITRCSGTQFDPAAVQAFIEADRTGLVREPGYTPAGTAPSAALTATPGTRGN